jgi:CHRD domain-containing protein
MMGEQPRFKAPVGAVEEPKRPAPRNGRRALGGLALVGVGAVAGIGISQVDDALSGTAICCKGGTPLHGALYGKNEIDAAGRKGVGDKDARGSAAAVLRGKLCFGLTVKDLGKPIAAHIHQGKPGENGPIVVTLKAPKTGNPGASSGCVTVPDQVIRAIKANPGDYYWNIHTQGRPGGAIRGQLFNFPNAE